jgi:hypothetical protein
MANTRTSTDPERDDRSQDADRQHSDHAGVEVGTTFERTVDEGRGRLRRTWPGLLATGAVGGVDSCSRPRRSTTPSWCLWRCLRPCDPERPLATWTGWAYFAWASLRNLVGGVGLVTVLRLVQVGRAKLEEEARRP